MTRLWLMVENAFGSTVLHVDETLEALPAEERQRLCEEIAGLVARLGSPVETEEAIAVLAEQARRGEQ